MNQKENLYGPLKNLIGIWEGNKGIDQAPNTNRTSMENAFRERITFEAVGPVKNHEQVLYGVRYVTNVWTLKENSPFHEEMGYYLWCNLNKEVIKSFVIPRGMSVSAGGKSQLNANSFTLLAEHDDSIYTIASNSFLEREFKTLSYAFNLNFIDQKTIHYEQLTKMLISKTNTVFDHTDSNTLHKI